jgi:hypothetical protein
VLRASHIALRTQGAAGTYPQSRILEYWVFVLLELNAVHSTASRLKTMLLTIFIIPLLSVVALSVLDYNRFIQIPYWSLFSFCYLFPEAELSICSVNSIDAVLDWTLGKWNWHLESAQPGSVTPIPEIKALDFSYGLLNELTKGFTVPVVTRGLFNGSQVRNRSLQKIL